MNYGDEDINNDNCENNCHVVLRATTIAMMAHYHETYIRTSPMHISMFGGEKWIRDLLVGSPTLF